MVECKRPGAKPTEKQYADHKLRKSLGVDVRVIDSIEDAKNFTG
jgi:hypothetical protein